MELIEIKQRILNKIKEYQSIIIIRHIKPDGDCIGCTIGLKQILKESFPEKQIYSTGTMNSEYLDFLHNEDDDVNEETYKKSLVIAVDTATKDRLDCSYFEIAKETIKIDHHVNVENFGNINYVREDLPAACAIITDFYMTFKDELKLSEIASKALYVGMVTDTGRFKYRGVNGNVLRYAAELLDRNLDLENLYANLYIKKKEELHLQGYILNKFKTTKSGVSYFCMTRSIQKRFKVSIEDASALVNTLDSIRNNLIWIFFIEQPSKEIRVRLRSRFVAINELAAKYNGGGHKQASGATVNSKKEIKKLLNDADILLEEFKKENNEVF